MHIPSTEDMMRTETGTTSELQPAEVELAGLDNCNRLIRDVLSSIRDNRIDPVPYLDASYVHPNGFTRIKIPHELPDTGALYLNVWQPGVVESDIHDHRFNFLSTIVSGHLQHALWVETDAERPQVGGNHYLHDSRSTAESGRSSKLTHLGRSALDIVDDITLHAGNIYSLQHTALHSVTPDTSSVTRTLVHQTPDVSVETNVIKPDGTERAQDIYTRLTFAAYIAELEAALRA